MQLLWSAVFFFLSFYCMLAADNVGSTVCESEAVPSPQEFLFVRDIPSASVDLVVPGNDAYSFLDNQNFQAIVRSQNKVVIFAVPGAFTPTCSSKHLPGFVTLTSELKSKGVDAVYCLSVNDKYVMKAWADSTPKCLESGIVMVADGNGEFTKAFNTVNDRTSGRMGLRSQRYAAVVQNGNVTNFFRDLSGFKDSAAENVLSFLSN
jgi:peroxiredoxin